MKQIIFFGVDTLKSIKKYKRLCTSSYLTYKNNLLKFHIIDTRRVWLKQSQLAIFTSFKFNHILDKSRRQQERSKLFFSRYIEKKKKKKQMYNTSLRISLVSLVK